MAQRQWRISVDGATICCGTAVSTAPEGATAGVPPLRVVAAGWCVAPAARLRDPAEVLCSELLALVFSYLSVRERLAGAAVNSAWCRELSPAAAPRNACAWARLDLSAAAFPLPAGTSLHVALLQHLLPRYGAHVRALSLRCTDIDDDTLRAVMPLCPLLRELDLRGCESALGHDCVERPGQSTLLQLLVDLYARAAPGERFSLRLYGSGIGECDSCGGEVCDDAELVARNALHVALTWPVKAAPDAPPAGSLAVGWLRCDLEPCPQRWYFSDTRVYICNTMLPADVPEWTRESGIVGGRYMCGACGKTVCENCITHEDCPANPGGMCLECFDAAETFCEHCQGSELTCHHCCSTKCMAPGCDYKFCDSCLADDDSAVTRCSDCRQTACFRHSDGCDRCSELPQFAQWYTPHKKSWTTLDKGDFRAMMRCCACQRTYCHDCDPGPDGQAGARACGEDDGCIFCASRPEACSGLVDAEEAWREASDIEEERARVAGEEDGF